MAHYDQYGDDGFARGGDRRRRHGGNGYGDGFGGKGGRGGRDFGHGGGFKPRGGHGGFGRGGQDRRGGNGGGQRYGFASRSPYESRGRYTLRDIRVSPSVYNDAKEVADTDGVSIFQFARDAINLYLEHRRNGNGRFVNENAAEERRDNCGCCFLRGIQITPKVYDEAVELSKGDDIAIYQLFRDAIEYYLDYRRNEGAERPVFDGNGGNSGNGGGNNAPSETPY